MTPTRPIEMRRRSLPPQMAIFNRVSSIVRFRFPQFETEYVERVVWDLIRFEKTFSPDPPYSFPSPTHHEGGDRTYNLEVQLKYVKEPEPFIAGFEKTVLAIFAAIPKPIPSTSTSTPFRADLRSAVDMREFVHFLYETIRGAYPGFFTLIERTNLNLRESEIWMHQGRFGDEKFSDEKVFDAFFRNTPLANLLATMIDLPFEQSDRFSHTHILAPTGSGKTTLLETMIMHDLKSDASVVLIDPHESLIPKLTRSAALNGKRLLIITPKDIKHPPAINIFDVRKTDDPVEKEQVFAGVLKVLTSIFAERGTDLTGKQDMVFSYICRLMLALPEAEGRTATVIDILHFLTDPAPYAKAISTLSPLAQGFFKDFNNPKSTVFRHTAEQLRYRLNTLLSNPALERFFSSTVTKINFREELDRGSVILIDTAQSFLKDTHEVWGKIFIGLILEAVRERTATPENQRHPAFLYVDEAHSFFDDNIDQLLTDARKFRLGCIFAHHNLSQCAPGLRASLSGSVIKFAAPIADDAPAVAKDMRTTTEFLLTLPQYTFGAYIRHKTPSAVSVAIERSPSSTITEAQYRERWSRSRALTSAGVAPTTGQPVSPPPKLQDEDVSDKW